MKWLLLGICLLMGGELTGQTFIGQTKEEVKEVMKEEYTSFRIDRSIVKQAYNYLKYVNHSETITWIIYFSDKDRVTASKKVCDYSEFDFVIDELDEKYRRTGVMQWQYEEDGESYKLVLEELDWYFTVRESKIE